MRTTKNKPITAQQVKALHAVFRQMGMDADERHEFIANLTDGRTCSTKELTMDEARSLLDNLGKNQREAYQRESKQVCKQIYALSFQISFINKGFDNGSAEEFEMNKAKINMFCRKNTRFHKNLTEMSLAELKEVKKQMEAIARKES